MGLVHQENMTKYKKKFLIKIHTRTHAYPRMVYSYDSKTWQQYILINLGFLTFSNLRMNDFRAEFKVKNI